MKQVNFLMATVFYFGGAFAQTQVPHEFQAGTPAVATEVNENFSTLEAAIDQNTAAISQISAGPEGPPGPQGEPGAQGPAGPDFPRWRVLRRNLTGEYVEATDIMVDVRSFNRDFDQGLALVQVKLTDGSPPPGYDWYPAVIRNGSSISFGYQGLERNHTILAFQPGSNCTGNPVAIIEKSWKGNLEQDYSWPSRFYTTYDFRNGNIYRITGGGTSSANVVFDLLEYGYEKGWFPAQGQNFGCSTNVDLSTRQDLTIDGGSQVLQFDAVFLANMPPDAGQDLVMVFR